MKRNREEYLKALREEGFFDGKISKTLKKIAEERNLSYDFLRQVVSQINKGKISKSPPPPLQQTPPQTPSAPTIQHSEQPPQTATGSNEEGEKVVVGEGEPPEEVLVYEVDGEGKGALTLTEDNISVTSSYEKALDAKILKDEEKPHLNPNLFWSIEDVILNLYAGNTVVIDQMYNLVTKQFPYQDLKEMVLNRLIPYWRVNNAILVRLRQDLEQDMVLAKVTDPAKKEDLRISFFNILNAIKHYSIARQFYEKLEKDKLYRRNPYILGVLVFAYVKITCYCLLAQALLKIKNIVEKVKPLYLGIRAAHTASRYELGIYKGNALLSPEERDVLQLIAANAMSPSPIPNEDLERYIKLALLSSALQLCATIDPRLYPRAEAARNAFVHLKTSDMIKRRLEWMKENIEGEKRAMLKLHYDVKFKELQDFYTPIFYVPKPFWKAIIQEDENLPGGILEGITPLVPVIPKKGIFPIPLFSRFKQPVLNLILAPSGSGKTVLLDSLATYRVEKFKAVVFRPSMPREQGLGVIAPLGPYVNALKMDYKNLMEQKIKPKGYPAIFLTIAESENDIMKSQIWTVGDRIFFVNDLEDFDLPWTQLYRELKSKGGGFLMCRSLSGMGETNKARESLLKSFLKWRRYEAPSAKIVMQMDEVHELAPSIPYGDEATLAHALDQAFRDLRGLGIPVDAGTQRPNDIKQTLIESITPTLFIGRFVETGREAIRTSRDRALNILKSLLNENERMYIPLVEKIMDNRDLQKNHLFFLACNGKLRLVRAALPPFCVETPGYDFKKVLKRAEEAYHIKFLVNYDEVPKIDLGGKKKKKVEAEVFDFE